MSLSRRELLHNLGIIVGASTVAACSSKEDDAPTLDSPFKEGVASGDPLATAVILWTRVTASGPVEVKWEVSTTKDFAQLSASGSFNTSADRDFTVKVDATGLGPATTYYYRFKALGRTSPVGRTRTAPTGAVSRLRFGVVSCSSYAHGYFHAYRHLATRADLDAILHLGDYIYEYGDSEYGKARKYDPAHEIVSLADYRKRYAHYRRDPDLAELHRQFPFITVWDDHETADNSWSGGAENHSDYEGDYGARKKVAQQAYSEWMPIRDQTPDKIYRALSYGDLVDVIMLDTRITGRDKQLEKADDPALADEKRSVLGAAQETWLSSQLASSKAKWQLLGQQIVLATFPAFFNGDAWDGYPAARERLYKILETNAGKNVVVLTGDIHMSFGFELPRDPKSPDYDPATGKGSLGVEIVVPGVTSPGYPDQLASVAKQLMVDHKHVKFADVNQRGYAVLDITPERLQAAWYHYTEVEKPAITPKYTGAVAVKAGEKKLAPDMEAAAPTNAPPHA
jgi:alkaline phosphatase D